MRVFGVINRFRFFLFLLSRMGAESLKVYETSPLFKGWNTQSEQQIHAYQNELQPRGEKHHYAKLTLEEVIQIKQLLRGGVLQKDIAIKFHVSQQVISAINTGTRWNHIAA